MVKGAHGIIDLMDIGYILTVLGVIFVSMTLHEVMHGLVAYRLGDDTAHLMGRLTLNPLKHIDPFMTVMLPLLIIITNAMTGTNTPVFGGAKPVPFNPARIAREEWGIALMAIAGPLTNVLLAFLSFAILVFIGDSTGVLGQIALTSVWVNLGFFAFNILPIPPLDGSRVMYALAPDFVREAMDAIERYGIIFVFVVVMFANSLLHTYMSNVITWCIALFSRIFGVA
jgi:Zn-dependent protease